MTATQLLVGAVACLLALYLGCTHSTCPQHSHSEYFEHECAGKPHHSSWSSWWHPQREDGRVLERGQGAGETTRDWNILYHLGGNGPWVEKVSHVVESGIAVPDGCVVEQVHMMARHAERYPSKTAGRKQKAVVEKMKKSGIQFTGSLAFFNTWELFWTDDASLEQLTSTGPFSGRLGAFTTGVRLRTRYHHLLEQALAENKTNYWATSSPRVAETARHFALGFFGLDAPARLEVISESVARGADTLTPGRTCLNNLVDLAEGKAKGYRRMGEWRDVYLPPIAARLSAQTGLNFTGQDVFSMQEMCGFEITARGRSDWCNVFSQEEFLAFEYARDVLHYYRAGPGMKYAAAMGGLWLKATTKLMMQGPGAGPLFFSFVHDGDIAPLVTALDMLPDEEELATTHIKHERAWRKSEISPMGGRILFELLSCNATATQGVAGKYVRVNINDGITALHDCHDGPGESCGLEAFEARTRRGAEAAGGFGEVCGVGGEGGVVFLRQ